LFCPVLLSANIHSDAGYFTAFLAVWQFLSGIILRCLMQLKLQGVSSTGREGQLSVATEV
jgi:hypothetical protein